MSALSSFRRRLMAGAYPKEQPNYLCFTALEDGTFTFTILSGTDTTNYEYIEYSTDGRNWIRTNNVSSTEVVVTTPTIHTGEKVYWRGYGYVISTTSNNVYSHFSSTGGFNVEGNISSLVLGESFATATEYRRRFATNHGANKRTFYGLFYNCTGLVDASLLILPNIAYNYMCSVYESLFLNCTGLTNASFDLPIVICEKNNGNYGGMFSGCTSLVNPPTFKMTQARADDFTNMFYGCTSLVNAPDITSVVTISSGSFYGMFNRCSSLAKPAKMAYFTTVYNNCFFSMYDHCTTLEEAPVLPAETLAVSCYYFMFSQSNKIRYIKMLATDISATGCLNRWVEGFHNSTGGIFVKHINATWTNTGASGVPTNWTVIYYDPALDKYYTDQTRATECDDHGNPI